MGHTPSLRRRRCPVREAVRRSRFAWFYAHITLQIVGYAKGVAGWVTGLNLNDEHATGGDPGKHGAIGGVLFGICTLQMLALFLRPKKEHKIRKVWNLYHYSLAASILILGIINIFEGFEIMSPPAKWRRAYIGIAIMLEIVTWIYVYRKKRYSQAALHGATVGGTYDFEKGPVGRALHVQLFRVFPQKPALSLFLSLSLSLSLSQRFDDCAGSGKS
ncbi:hypothetical protein KP509_11G016100 [Ceratopteris richardii]|uniref:Cytochrome b561 domain-containing protein n=1 Tax=Ceratopteris richardii TaxID=49495 RepID=A0A8T2TMD2_CERRI|nr:hypothetical protein KP509_11G016100 [Ceratopteris richardii]